MTPRPWAVYRDVYPATPTLLGHLPAESRDDAERLGWIRWGVRCVAQPATGSMLRTLSEADLDAARESRRRPPCRIPPPPVAAPAWRGRMSETEIPRRNDVLRWTPAELSIGASMQAVEQMPADVRLTDAVVLLAQAKERVADYVDGVCGKSATSTEVPILPHADEAEAALAALRGTLLHYVGTTDPELLAEVFEDRERLYVEACGERDALAMHPVMVNAYPHMCRADHPQIGHMQSDDDERCPLCRANDNIADLRATLAERERDAARLDWLEKHSWRADNDGDLKGPREMPKLYVGRDRSTPPITAHTMRAAIDAALASATPATDCEA